MKKIYFSFLFIFLFVGTCIFAQVTTFNYTGAFQTYLVPAGVTTICVDVRGGQGMSNLVGNAGGGNGGRVTGTLTVVPGATLRIYVGNGGVISNAGGFNGGANGGVVVPNIAESPSVCATSWGGGGGGSSDIRVTPYALANRVVIAGGGGGTGGERQLNCSPGCGGGGGGGYYGGGGGGAYGGSPGFGGTQAAGGAGGASCCGCPLSPQPGAAGVLGIGGAGGNLSGGNLQFADDFGCLGGPGGANIGGQGPNCTGGTGCPSTWAGASGGGGSNFVGALVGSTNTQGFQSGNGQVIINCVILPITLMNFDAKYKKTEQVVELNWSTSTERNNKTFIVERSTDALDWQTVSTLEGAGTSNVMLNYRSKDETPFNGVSYYRLNQIDYNGNSTFSDITEVNINADYAVNISPNPTNGNITLKYSCQTCDAISVQVTDLSGKVFSVKAFTQVQKGTNNYEINTSDLAPGMYFIRATNSQKTFNLKFAKE